MLCQQLWSLWVLGEFIISLPRSTSQANNDVLLVPGPSADAISIACDEKDTFFYHIKL